MKSSTIDWQNTQAPAAGVESINPAEGKAALRALADQYERLDAVSYEAAGMDVASIKQALHVSLLRGGDFKVEHFSATSTAATAQLAKKPSYVVCYNEKTLFVTRNEGNTYAPHAQPDLWEQTPPFIQLIYAPWPRLAQLARSLADDPACALERTDGRWKAESTQQGVTLVWSVDQRLHEFIRHGAANATARTIFSDFRGVDGFALPGTMRVEVRTGLLRDGKEVGSDATYSLSRISIDRSTAEREAVFDAKALGVNRFDESTKNVYDTNGRFLYNESGTLLEAAPTLGASKLIGIGVIGALCAVVAVVFFKRRARLLAGK